MAARTTTLADGPRMKAFRAVEDVLREDPALSASVRTWSTWNGDGNDRMPVAADMLPYLQMSPVMYPNEPMGVGRIVAKLGVRITVAVAGLVAEDLVNLWDAVEDALVKGKEFRGKSIACYLQEHHAFAEQMLSPAITAWQSENNPPLTFLQGSGQLLLRISRPA